MQRSRTWLLPYWIGLYRPPLPRKKNVMLPSATDHSQYIQNKLYKTYSQENTQFLSDWVFVCLFFEKKKRKKKRGEHASKFCTFGYFKNVIRKTNKQTKQNKKTKTKQTKKNHIYFLTNLPKYSDIPLEGDTKMFPIFSLVKCNTI